MMTLEEIKNVSFRKANIGGYRVDDVDDFIDKVEEMFGTMLRSAGISAAPASGDESAKQAASVVVGSCTDGAVADFIDYLEQN